MVPGRVGIDLVDGLDAVLAAGATWEAGASNATAATGTGLLTSFLVNKTVLITIVALAGLLGLFYLLPADEIPDTKQQTIAAVTPPPKPEPPQDPESLMVTESVTEGTSVKMTVETEESGAFPEGKVPDEVLPLTVSGYAVDEFGQPVPGASIVLLAHQEL